MSDLFENYEELEQDVYKKFKFDLNGCGDEIKVIAYLVFLAQEKAFSSEMKKIDELAKKMDSNVTKFEEINTGLNRSLMSTLKLFADLFDSKFNEISKLKDDVRAELSAALKNEVNSMATSALKHALSVNGISLNDELKNVVSTLNDSAENSIAQASSLNQKVSKSISGMKLKLVVLPLAGSIIGFIIMLLMQSIGMISVPVTVNIDVVTLAREILHNLR